MPKEVVTINVGGTGSNLTPLIWDRYYKEYGINTDGLHPSKPKPFHRTNVFFDENKKSSAFVPRNLSIDIDTHSFDELHKYTKYAKLLDDNFLIKGDTEEDACNLYPIGYNSKLIDIFKDRTRQLIEKCDNFDGFIINHSLTGGTGSGLTSHILEQLSLDYKKNPTATFTIEPSRGWGVLNKTTNTILSPYNSILYLNNNIEYCNLSVTMDNEKFRRFCEVYRNIKFPNINDVNQMIVNAQSYFTQSMRFENYGFGQTTTTFVNESIGNIVSALVPLEPRLHFCLTSLSPIPSVKSSGNDIERTTHVWDPYVFHVGFYDFDEQEDLYISAIICYSGEIDGLLLCNGFIREIYANNNNNNGYNNFYYSDVMQLICDFYSHSQKNYLDEIKKTRKVNFAPCSHVLTDDLVQPGVVVNCFPPIHANKMNESRPTQFMIANNTAIYRPMEDKCRRFDLMFSSRAYTHWYEAEGMEIGEFSEARENIGFLQKDYLDCLADTDDED